MAVGMAKKNAIPYLSFAAWNEAVPRPRARAPASIAGLVERVAYPRNQSSLNPSPGPPPTGGHAPSPPVVVKPRLAVVTAGRDRVPRRRVHSADTDGALIARGLARGLRSNAGSA